MATTTKTVQLRGLDVSLTASTKSGDLFLSLKHDLEEWQGSFSPSYIEDLTKKTGNFKRFGIFAEMVFSTFGQNKGVTLDLISYDDLASFSGKKNKLHDLTELPFDKVYLLVTYAVAFDRVHYPLPLTRVAASKSGESRQVKQSPEETLKSKLATLERLHVESVEKMSLLIAENEKLRAQAKKQSKPSKVTLTSSTSTHSLSDRFLEKLDNVQLELRHMNRELNLGRSNPQGAITSIRQVLQEFTKALQFEFKIPASKTESRPRSISASSLIARKSRPNSSPSISSHPGYKVIKSQPLDRKEPSHVQSHAYLKSQSKRNASRPTSASPFRRFDPTQYIIEQEKKREKQRSSSRESLYSQRTLSRTPSVSSNRNYSTPLKKTMSNKSSAATLPPSSSRPSSSRQRSAIKLVDESAYQIPEPPITESNDIDARLAQLHAYLQSALPS